MCRRKLTFIPHASHEGSTSVCQAERRAIESVETKGVNKFPGDTGFKQKQLHFWRNEMISQAL